jgi:hypothetical protein
MLKNQAIEERMSVNKVKEIFYKDFHDEFFCIMPTLLHKFMLDKGIGHIFEYQPHLYSTPPNSDWRSKKYDWEKILEADCKDTREAWDFFLKK